MRKFNLVIAAATVALAAPAMAQSTESKVDYDCALYNDCADQTAEAGDEEIVGGVRGGFTMRRADQARASSDTSTGFTMRRAGPVVIPSPGTRARIAPRAPQLTTPRVTGPVGSRQEQASVRNAQLITFVSGSAQLQPSSKAVVARLAAAMNRPDKMGERFRVEGHTDASGSRVTNIELSTRRAQSVATQLIALGVNPNRLEVVGYGFDQPLPGTAGIDAANRRVVAKVIN
jgi:outer membrane protein OmpA-like peptidoglycan-associated protein